ncbi:hypothetical protein V7068_05800 [Bacillus sp. JJ634]
MSSRFDELDFGDFIGWGEENKAKSHTFQQLREKLVLHLTIKVLQTQQFLLSHYSFQELLELF